MTPEEAYGWVFHGMWALSDMRRSTLATEFERWTHVLAGWQSGLDLEELRTIVREARQTFLVAIQLYDEVEIRARLFLYAVLLSVEHPV